MTQVDERLAKVGQNLKKFISESKYKKQVSFALDGMGQDPSVIRRLNMVLIVYLLLCILLRF